MEERTEECQGDEFQGHVSETYVQTGCCSTGGNTAEVELDCHEGLLRT